MSQKQNKGFTLLEAVIALAIWMILSLGIFFAWHHAATRSAALLARVHAFENARGAMDSIIINLQMSQTIELDVTSKYILHEMTMHGYDHRNVMHPFVMGFNINARETDPMFQRIFLGATAANEVASGIAMVQVRPVRERPVPGRPIRYRRLNITIKTACEYPIILEGSVDIRYKCLTVRYR